VKAFDHVELAEDMLLWRAFAITMMKLRVLEEQPNSHPPKQGNEP
jgi:hypothetical protein